MKLKFLGTAASEGIPNPFCNCELCTKARHEGGKDVRTRASALIDGVIQIDLSPEWSAQLAREKLDARSLHTVLFTHTHPDHFNVGEFVSRCQGFGYNINSPLYVFGNDLSIKGAFNALDGLGGNRFILQVLPPFMTFEHFGYQITPTLANHAKMELCYNYLITKDGRTLFYGLDSGYLPESTFEFLKKVKIDVAILECTYASYREGDKTDNHLNFTSLFNEVARLKAQGTLDDNSKVYASHVSHSGKLCHQDLEALLHDHHLETAFDGLEIEI